MKRRSFVFGSVAICSATAGNIAFADDGIVVATGLFTKTITKGNVSLVKRGNAWAVRLEDNFILDGSPDPWVALGNDGFQYRGIIGELVQLSGAQEFPIGALLNPRDFNEVYIWCVDHNISLGRAALICKEARL